MALGDIIQVAGIQDLGVTTLSINGTAEDPVWATPTSGNRLVVFAGGDNPITDVATGFTLVDDVGAGSPDVEMWHKISDGTESTITVTCASGDLTFHAIEIEGGLDLELSQFNTVAAGTTLSTLTTGVLTATASVAVVTLIKFESSAPTWDNGYTIERDGTDTTPSTFYQSTASKALTGTAATETEATWSTSGDGSVILAIYVVASGVETSGIINGGGSISPTVVKHLNQELRPTSTITAGSWDTGPTTGQALHTYAGDDDDATWIEDTTA
jgi:hypothetical protein